MSKKNNKAETTESAAGVSDPVVSYGVFAYTDGGAKPNPGPAGWGAHICLYSTETPTKGNGSKYLSTEKGYVLKTDQVKDALVKQVTPIAYFNGLGGIPGIGTNNVGELTAVLRVLTHIHRLLDQYAVTKLVVVMDSEYVRKGLESWIHSWKKNNWTKRDQSPIPNVGIWQELDAVRTDLENRGVECTFQWVRGHDGHQGNEEADELATVARVKSFYCDYDERMVESVPDKYWNPVPSTRKHPLISHRRMYFNTLPATRQPGVYYLGEHGKEDEDFGMHTPTACYAIIRLATPEPTLEKLLDIQTEIAGGTDSVMHARLEQLFKPSIQKLILEEGKYALEQYQKPLLDLRTPDGQPATREYFPPLLALRAVEAIAGLAAHLDRYLATPEYYAQTDLTSVFYETRQSEKKGVVTTTTLLRPEFVVGYHTHKVSAGYQSDDGVKHADLLISLGIDLPNRNALKHLEAYSPKITLLTWMESPLLFRYVVVIQATDAVGIWSAPGNNVRVV